MNLEKGTPDGRPRSEHRLSSLGFRVSSFELEPGTLDSELETVTCSASGEARFSVTLRE
jgi:hypothetical protein